MNAIDGDATSTDKAFSRRMVVVTGMIVVGLFFILDDLLGLIGGGGIFSTMSAYEAAQARAASIDFDGAGLRTIFIVLCTIPTVLLSIALRLNLKKGQFSLLFMTLAMGGGFVLDAIYDETIITKLVSPIGYTRCISRDHHVGSGKSRVWFNNFVLMRSDCPAGPSRSLAASVKPPSDPRSQLPRPAQSIGSSALWFSQDDYPALAFRRNEEGVVKVRFVVDADGRVHTCTVIVSSGSPLLDTTTCGVLMTNARYWPARDADGKELPQTETRSVKWLIPKN